MRTSIFFSYALSTGAIVALLDGCSGSSNAGGSSPFAPPAQTSSTVPLASGDSISVDPSFKPVSCPIAKGDVPLASVASFAVLGGSTVTSTGLTVLDGDLGVSPGTSITGFGPGIVKHGTVYPGGPVAAQAQADLATAYNHTAALKNPTQVPPDIGGKTIRPGLYDALLTLGISGTVTLNGENNSDSVFIFQIPSTLTTGVNSRVALKNGANACNVFWQVGSAATLNTGSKFKGTIMAMSSISVGSGVRVRGRLLAEAGAVTLIDDRINRYKLHEHSK